MKKVQIKGKDYVPVSERILHIAENYQYSIWTEYDYFPERKMWVVKATLNLTKDGNQYAYSGLAQEIESDNYRDVNHTSALENAETSAVGRACAMAGIGIETGIASADEVKKALNRIESKPEVDEIGEEKRMYLTTLLENTTYEERQKEKLALRISSIMSLGDYEKALNNLISNQIEDKDRIAMGFNYNQSDINKALNERKI